MIGAALQRRRCVALVHAHAGTIIGTRSNSAFACGIQPAWSEHYRSLGALFLQAVALNARLMQADGIHPNEKGQPLLLETYGRRFKPLAHR